MKINKLILLIAPITLVGCKQEKEVVAVQSFAPANVVKTELSTIDLSFMNKTIRHVGEVLMNLKTATRKS